MRITSYSFGSITVDGRTYTSDVIIYPGRVEASWWRKEGHSLQPVDLEGVVRAKPDLLIVGTGSSGMMRVPGETIGFLESRGIEIQVASTTRAVELFNNAPQGKTVVAALHLTC
jgi:hypothetical protein